MITQPTTPSENHENGTAAATTNGAAEKDRVREPSWKTDDASWMDAIENDAEVIRQKLVASKRFKGSSKQQNKRLAKQFAARLGDGLPTSLLQRIEPLLKHIKTDNPNSAAIENLVQLAESATLTFLNLSGEAFEDFALDEDPRLLSALAAMVAAYRIRWIVVHGTDTQFERLVRSLDRLQQVEFESNDADSVLLHQWLTIELPLYIASQLPEIKHLRKNGKRAAKRFAEVTRELLDSDGWPGPNCHAWFAALMASWLRTFDAMERCTLEPDPSFRAQMEHAATQFFRLHTNRKRPLFVSEHDITREHDLRTSKSFAASVAEFASDKKSKKIAQCSGLIKSKKKWKHANAMNRLPDPSCVSQWAESAVLRGSWLPNKPYVGLDFSSPASFLEIGAAEKLITGPTELQIVSDGVKVDLNEHSFDIVCELHDEEISYLELEIQTEELKFFRQFLLSRDESFLYFADSIHKSTAGELDYRLDLPLAAGVNIVEENGTRELYLNRPGKDGIQSLVLPLSLPEWSIERCEGSLSSQTDDAGRPILSVQKTNRLRENGGALYSPIFFDLDPKRSRKKRTWRQLTVAQSLSTVGPDVAAAYRVQIDEQQWVFYRALREVGNRTFMGQNFAGDFYAGRFLQNGKVEDLIQVQ